MTETDLRGPLREGATDDELEAIIRDAVWRKELKHHVNDAGLRAAGADDVADRRMRISIDEALELVLDALAPLRPERVPLADAAGRVAAETRAARGRPAAVRPLGDGRLRGARRRHRARRARCGWPAASPPAR